MGPLTMPYVVERTPHGERQVDIHSRMLRDRVIMLTGEINDDSADIVTSELFFLESEAADEDIVMYVNSGGGVVTAGLALYDTMQYISCDVATVCIGQAASMAAVLLAAGAPGKRVALPNSRVMIHQPLGGARGQASDVEIQSREVIRIKQRLNAILAEHTGQPLGVIREDTDRDFFLNAEDAAEYGLVDTVVTRREG